MTVDGPEERPLALRELAQAESPDIVRAALGRFRRRLVTRGLIVLLIAATGLFLWPRYHRGPENLSQAIERGRGVDLLGTIRTDSVEATVTRVARLPGADGRTAPRFGIRLFVRPLSSDGRVASFLRPDPDRGVLTVREDASDYMGNSIQIWIDLLVGTSRIDIPMGVAQTEFPTQKVTVSAIDTVHVDMETLGVPDWSWR